MDKKTVIAVGVAIMVAAAGVSAASWTKTPLYTYRMEQASNTMHFLPTKMNTFSYTAEKGYTLTHSAGTNSLISPQWTVIETCPNTCVNTCGTCALTCETCDTCGETIYGTPTCKYTCQPSCLCGF